MNGLDALPADFRDLLLEFADANVEFVIIGVWAMAVHGRVRATEDLDVLVRPSRSNAARVIEALAAFGAPLDQHQVGPAMFESERYGYRFGEKPNQVEVLTTISGVDFDRAVRDALEIELEGRSIPVIGRDALLANKRRQLDSRT